MEEKTNIARFPFNYKGSGTIFYHLTNEEYCRFKRAGIIAKKLHAYRLVLNFREIQVECPVILHDKHPVAILLPAFKNAVAIIRRIAFTLMPHVESFAEL